MRKYNNSWNQYLFAPMAVMLLLLPSISEAGLFAEESFDYAPDAATLDGGLGFAGAWTGDASGADIDATGWDYTGLSTSGGRFLRDQATSTNSPRFERLLDLSPGSMADSAGLVNGDVIGVDDTTVWMSFLVRKGDTTPDQRWPWLADGLYTGNTDRVTVGRSERLTGGVLSSWSVNSANRHTNLSGETDPFTFFLFKIDFLAGSDNLNVWMNWDLASGEPDPNVDSPDFDDFDSDRSFDRLTLRWGQGNPDNRGMFDEFRLGTTFADVIGSDSPLPSDLNNNGFVDFEDLTILLANWNKDVGAADGNIVEPLVSVVNFADLTVLLADWTGPGPAGAPEAALGEAVPEPSTLLLGMIAALGLSFYRRRRRRTV